MGQHCQTGGLGALRWLLVLVTVFVASAGCNVFEARSDGFQCNTSAECDLPRTCQSGYCVLASATPDADLNAPDGNADGLQFRKTITVPAAKVEADLLNFPLLISTSDPEIFAAARSDGADMQFVGAGEQVLDYELELFAGGEMVAWVRIPTLSACADTTIELRYGDASASGLDNPAGVWTDFAFVLHLDQNPDVAGAGGILDSSGNGTHGTDVNMTSANQVDTIIGQGLSFDGMDNGARVEMGSIDLSATFTFSVWVKPVAGHGSGPETLIANAGSGTQSDGLKFFYRANESGRLHLETGNGSSGQAELGSNGDVADTDWNHVVAVFDRANGNADLYVDGAEVGNGGGTLNDFNVVADLRIGMFADGGGTLNGDLDELRVSTTLRPLAWIRASFANVTDVDFVQIGPQQAN